MLRDGVGLNGPLDGSNKFFHLHNYELGIKDGDGYITQLALPYGLQPEGGMHFRGFNVGSDIWSKWYQLAFNGMDRFFTSTVSSFKPVISAQAPYFGYALERDQAQSGGWARIMGGIITEGDTDYHGSYGFIGNTDNASKFFIDIDELGSMTTNFLLNDTGLGLGTSNPSFRLDVNGNARIMSELRLIDRVSGSATSIVGADSDGDIVDITLGTNLTLSGGTLNATGGGSDNQALSIDQNGRDVTIGIDNNSSINFTIPPYYSLEEDEQNDFDLHTLIPPFVSAQDGIETLVGTNGRIEVTVVDVPNKRFKIDRDLETIDFRRGTSGRPWSAAVGFTNVQVPDAYLDILYIDYENDWLYYDSFSGDVDPTVGEPVEFINSFANLNLLNDEQPLFPEFDADETRNGQTINYNNPTGKIFRKSTGDLMGNTLILYTDGDQEVVGVESKDNGKTWSVEGVVSDFDDTHNGVLIKGAKTIYKIPNSNPEYAGNYVVFINGNGTDTLAAYKIIDEDYNEIVGYSDFNVNALNRFSFVDAQVVIMTHYNDKIRFVIWDKDDSLANRGIYELTFNFTGNVMDILEGDESLAGAKTTVILNSADTGGGDFDEGYFHPYGYLKTNGSLNLIVGQTHVFNNSLKHLKRTMNLHELQPDGTSWDYYKKNPVIAVSPLLFRLRSETTYDNFEDRLGVSAFGVVGDKILGLLGMAGVGGDSYETFAAEITQNRSGKLISESQTGSVLITETSQDVFFNKKFDYPPIVTVTNVTTGTPLIPVIENVDKFKFRITWYDLVGSQVTTGNFNFFAKTR